ncbi:hypothetical protein MCP_1601 [Methanocella paludicola SANAE]|uniref:Uncharacterized protein n=2 Tax=Methanocella TaxID=570266 RepID=D1YZ01_METPS|nr:hypothetical protein MCP_1601 [Methanocella paludicola SANAE]
MGIDRYLATSGLKDIKILHDMVTETRKICNDKLNNYINIYQEKWNLTSVSLCIKKMFNPKIYDSAVTSCMYSDQQRVIYVLLDGFGYSQYLWLSNGLKERKSTTFGINLFEWLQGKDEYNDKLILGSTLITDTGAALTTIFTGLLPVETRVISSKVYNGTLNDKEKIADVKRVAEGGLSRYIGKKPETFLNHIKDIQFNILSATKSSKVTSDFTKMLYGDNNVVNIDPSDRLFKNIVKTIVNNKKQLIIAYYPLIDHSGHTIGSFTSFESYEYEKLNLLLVEFMLDLAKNKKEIFDGKTTIIFSADHGMFETSSKYITKKEIKEEFEHSKLKSPYISVSNRCLLFYDINRMDLEESYSLIKGLLEKKGIPNRIYRYNDPIIEKLLCKKNEPIDYRAPDIVCLFSDEGIAVPFKDIDETMLHYGGHGGCSSEEVFVPFITLRLTERLYEDLTGYFSKLG